MIWGHVVFATQETSPYDIAVVSLEEDLQGIPLPVPTEHFHEGKGQSWSSGLGKTSGSEVSAGHSDPLDWGANALGGFPAHPLLG